MKINLNIFLIKDWNDMTTTQLAYNAQNKEFMAHAACQKWLTRQFYGEITPRDLQWDHLNVLSILKYVRYNRSI